MSDQMADLKKLYDAQALEISSLKETNVELKQENCALRASMKDVNSRLGVIEQLSRENNLEVQGVPEANNENVIRVIKKISQAVNFDLKGNDLVTAHRVVKLNNESSRPRAIVVKLASPLIRDNFLASIRVYNRANDQDKLNTSTLGLAGEKTAVYVSQHLSPANKQLHAATRAAAADKKYQFVWIRNGRVFVRKDIKSKPIVVKDLDAVKSL